MKIEKGMCYIMTKWAILGLLLPKYVNWDRETGTTAIWRSHVLFSPLAKKTQKGQDKRDTKGHKSTKNEKKSRQKGT